MDKFEFLMEKIGALYAEVAQLVNKTNDLASQIENSGGADLSDITDRLSSVEEDVSSLQEDVNSHTTSISQLTPTVATHTKKLNALYTHNYIINPDFYICQNTHTLFETYGTEVAFVDNWLMGTTTTGLVSYTYGTNIFTLCKNGYIKQDIMPDALRVMPGKKVVVTVCVSGAVPSGIQLCLTYKTTTQPNGVNKKVNINGTGDKKTYSTSYTVTDKTTALIVKVMNSGNNSADVKINWLKCELADEYTSYIAPLETLEKLRCTFTGQ